MITLAARRIEWELTEPFAISRGSFSRAEGVLVTVTDAGKRRGRGEAYGMNYEGETPESMFAQIESVRGDDQAGIVFERLGRG